MFASQLHASSGPPTQESSAPQGHSDKPAQPTKQVEYFHQSNVIHFYDQIKNIKSIIAVLTHIDCKVTDKKSFKYSRLVSYMICFKCIMTTLVRIRFHPVV